MDTLWDPFRKKSVSATPEEWVRQGVLAGLLAQGYPSIALAVEKSVLVYGKRKRFDILVFKKAKPWMVIECKAPHISLDQDTLNQVFSYRIALDCPYAMITNGTQHFLFEAAPGEEKGVVQRASLPTFAP